MKRLHAARCSAAEEVASPPLLASPPPASAPPASPRSVRSPPLKLLKGDDGRAARVASAGSSPRSAHVNVAVSVSASSIAAADSGTRSRATFLLPAEAGMNRASHSSAADGASDRRNSTAVVDSVHDASHTARDTASSSSSSSSNDSQEGGSGNKETRGRRDMATKAEKESTAEGTTGAPLKIEKDVLDDLGSKRHRVGRTKLSGSGGERAHGEPPLRRSRQGSLATDRKERVKEREKEEEGRAPTMNPPPLRTTPMLSEARRLSRTPAPRQNVVLTATPAFLKGEPRRQEAEETPARSTLARGFSHLLDSAAPAAAPPAPAHPPSASPWGLSSIKAVSPRPSIAATVEGTRRVGSDFAVNLWPDSAAKPTTQSPSPVALGGHPQRETAADGREERLSFLRSSVGHSSQHRSGSSGYRRSSGCVTEEPQDDKENAQPLPSVHTQHATPSGISTALRDIISSSSSSSPQVRRSVPAPPPARPAQPSGSPSPRASTASTLMEPDLSPIRRHDAALGAREQRPPFAAPLPAHATDSGARLAGQRRAGREEYAAALRRHTTQVPAEENAYRGREDPPRWDRGPPPLAAAMRQRGRGAAYDYLGALAEEELMRAENDDGRRGEPRHRDSARRSSAHKERRTSSDDRTRWVAPLTRTLCAGGIAACMILVLLSLILPLLAASLGPLPQLLLPHRGNPNELLVLAYVNPVAELHALYQVPVASLSYGETRRLYFRILGESVERLERVTALLYAPPRAFPSDSEGEDDEYAEPTADMWQDADALPLGAGDDGLTTAHEQHLRYLRQMLLVYETARRRALLYARSRDRSLWRRVVRYPVEDVWRYAVARHGLWAGVWQSLLHPSASGALDRVVTAVACASGAGDDLAIAPVCPTLRYREEAMVKAAEQNGWLYYDVNAPYAAVGRQRQQHMLAAKLRRDWESEVYLETLVQFVRRDTLQGLRTYNRPYA